MTEGGIVAKRALLKATIVTLIALFVSAGIFLTDLRYWGSDISQSILAEYPAGALGTPRHEAPPTGSHDALRSAPRNWVFLDLGPRFCAPGNNGSESICPPVTARTDPARLARLIRWAATAGPRVVVVDVTAVRSTDERRMLQALLSAPPAARTPILIALPLDQVRWSGPIDDPVIGVNRELVDLLAPEPGSTIRLLPALIRPPDPTSRLLLAEIQVVGWGARTRLPTLSFGAALVARSPADAPFRSLDSFEDDRIRGAAEHACERLVDEQCRRAFASTERVFSFPPAAAADEQGAGEEVDRKSTSDFLYLYLPAPRVGEEDRPPQDLRDAVVVIGDSRHGAEDRHFTSVGDVSGAEILLNDIRQYGSSHPLPARNLLRYLSDELPYLAIGFFVAAAVAATLAWRRRRARRRKRNLWLRLIGGLADLVLVGALTFVAFVLYLLFSMPHGQPDFVTPFVTLLFGSMIESLYRFLSTVEARFGTHELGE